MRFLPPDADDQEHRDQPRLEEQIEQDQVQRREDADHQPFQHQEGDHVFLDPHLDVPAGQDGQRHQEGGQHDEQDGDPVDAHLVAQAHDPGVILDELEARVRRLEARQQEQRHKEGRAGRDQGQPLGVLLRCGVVAAQEQGQDARRHDRQEGDDERRFVMSVRAPASSPRSASPRCPEPSRRRSGTDSPTAPVRRTGSGAG